MILYLDTSSLFKLFVREQGSQALERVAETAEAVTTSIIAYTEFRGSLARAERAGRLKGGTYRQTLVQFERAWSRYSRVELDESLVRSAGELAARHFLRGLDAIHLASAIALRSDLGQSLTFSTADDRLAAAAGAERLSVVA